MRDLYQATSLTAIAGGALRVNPAHHNGKVVVSDQVVTDAPIKEWCDEQGGGRATYPRARRAITEQTT